MIRLASSHSPHSSREEKHVRPRQRLADDSVILRVLQRGLGIELEMEALAHEEIGELESPVPPAFRRTMPSAVVRSAAGTLSFCAAMSISAFRAVAAACRF